MSSTEVNKQDSSSEQVVVRQSQYMASSNALSQQRLFQICMKRNYMKELVPPKDHSIEVTSLFYPSLMVNYQKAKLLQRRIIRDQALLHWNITRAKRQQRGDFIAHYHSMIQEKREILQKINERRSIIDDEVYNCTMQDPSRENYGQFKKRHQEQIKVLIQQQEFTGIQLNAYEAVLKKEKGKYERQSKQLQELAAKIDQADIEQKRQAQILQQLEAIQKKH